MKKTLLFAAAGTILLHSCTNSQDKQKELLSTVLKAHEQVMADDEKAETYKLQLDTLLKNKPALKDQIAFISTELVAADSSMSEWMHKFNPDALSKPSAETVNYLTEQKKQLAKVDAQLNNANDKAARFITQNK